MRMRFYLSVTPSFCMRTRQWDTMHSREFLTHCIISKWLAVRLTWGFDPKKVVFRIIEKVVFIRSRIMNMPYGDQSIFIKRKFFHQIGCFREIPIMEDVDLIRRIKNSGGKITIISSKVQTVPRRWEREGILYCAVRNWMLVSLFFIGVSPAILARFYKETPSMPTNRFETKPIL